MPSSLDVGFNQRAGSILRDRLKKASVIVVSHQAATLEKFVRKAAVLRDGTFASRPSLPRKSAEYAWSMALWSLVAAAEV